MLLIVTPNPALDRTMVIPGVYLGGVHRAERVLVAPGGKGLNVARAARALGHPLCVCAPLGGLTGQMVANLAAEEGFESRWSWHSAGETRTCVLVVDPQGGDATALNEQGPVLSPGDWRAFMDTVRGAATDARLATISGSLPPGVPPTAMTELVRMLTAAGCRVFVDTSGAALVAALAAPPYAVKVNSTELSAALGTPVTTMDQAAAALVGLRVRGIPLVVVSLGAQGALATSDEGTCWVRPPTLEIVSTVGSGDSLLAGMTTGLLRGYPFAEALRLGVACGTADALTIGGGILHISDVEHIRATATVQWI